MFGNLLGASGAVDLIATILAMEHNAVPPMINVEVPDPEGLNYTINKAHEKEINKALVISRGRGGINTVIVIEKKEVA
jgi:3-oxoacyl-[acyl-carrier-protein] synthase II